MNELRGMYYSWSCERINNFMSVTKWHLLEPINEPQPKKNRVDPDDYNIHYMKMHDFLVVAFAKQHINRPKKKHQPRDWMQEMKTHG